MFYTPPPGKERPGSQQRDQRTPEEEAGSKRKEQAKAAVPADNAEQQRDPAKGKGPSKEKPKPKELWEIGPLGASLEPEPSLEPVAERPRKRRLRRPASRGEEASTIMVVRFPARGPPSRTTLRVSPMEGAEQASQVHHLTTQVATAPVANTTTRAEEDPVGEQTPQVAKVPVMRMEEPAAEETLPGMELLRAQAPAADLTTAQVEIQIPTWNLAEQIPIAPQIWDADTPQIVEETADEDVDIVTLDDAVHEPPKKSPKEKRRKKRKRSAHQDSDGRRASRLQRAGPADTTETAEDEG
jgi:hypothetical protein